MLWSFFFFLLAFFQVQRLGMLVRHWGYFGASAPGAALARSFVHGVSLDAATAGYLMLPPALLALVLVLAGARAETTGRSLRWLMLALLVPVTIAAWGELEFFGYFRDRYNALAVEYLDTPGVVTQTIWERYHPLLVAAEAALSWEVLRRALRFCDARLSAAAARGRAAAGVLLSIALAVLVLRGGWGLVPTRWGSAYFSTHTAANQLALNGLFSLATEMEYGDSSRPYRYYSEAEALERAREILSNPDEPYTGSTADPLEKRVAPRQPMLLKVDKPSIVIVLMESFSAQAVGTLGGSLAASPEFDRLSKDGILFTQYYSQGFRTGRALFSVLAGMPAPPGTNIMKSSAGRRHFTTLAGLLHAQGYRCRFVYGGDLNFENMDGFLRHNDFDELIGVGDFPGGRLWQWRTKWGVPDHLVFDRAHDLLSADTAPSLTVVLTLTNHPPFRLPPDATRPYAGLLADERNALGYSDWALGRFIEKARTSSYFKKTLFVVMGDHGQFYEGAPSSEIALFHVPCLFYGPEVLAVAPGRVDALAGHTDIAPTIVGLLGRGATDAFWGRDLFHQPEVASRILTASYRGMLLIEPGQVLKDEPGAYPVLYLSHEADRLEKAHEMAPDSTHPLLVKERSLTQVLKRLTGPHGPDAP